MEFPGMAIIPHFPATDKQDFISRLWVAVEQVNESFETFARISRDMILILPHDVVFPETDKRTVKRATFYSVYDREIQNMYSLVHAAHANGNDLDSSGKIQCNGETAIQDYLITLFRDSARLKLPSIDSVFFDNGLNSMQAAAVVRRIKRA